MQRALSADTVTKKGTQLEEEPAESSKVMAKGWAHLQERGMYQIHRTSLHHPAKGSIPPNITQALEKGTKRH